MTMSTIYHRYILKCLLCFYILLSGCSSDQNAISEIKTEDSEAEIGLKDERLLPPFSTKMLDSSEDTILFSINGSNTVGAELAPRLSLNYLQAKGVEKVWVEPAGKENELWVMGELPNGQEAKIFIAAHGSGTAFKGLRSGHAQIGAASRQIKDKELALFDSNINMKGANSEHVLAIDGLAIIVHPDNPISQLDKVSVAKIFSGEFDDWSQVGNHAGKINIYARDSKSGTWDTFKSLVLQKQYKLDESARRFESNDELSSLVERDTNGIGFTALASVGNTKPIKISVTDEFGLSPNKLTVATEDYPLSRRLFLYTLPDLDNPYAKEFIEFSLSEKGQDVVEQVGFVSQNIVEIKPPMISNAPKRFKKLVENGKRLSVNFRFSGRKFTLDNKAVRDIDRLINYVELNGIPQEELMLIGYAERRRNMFESKQLSKLRAMNVHFAIKKTSPFSVSYEGLGDLFPIDNDGTNPKNTRVEVWRLPAKIES